MAFGRSYAGTGYAGGPAGGQGDAEGKGGEPPNVLGALATCRRGEGGETAREMRGPLGSIRSGVAFGPRHSFKRSIF